MGNSVSHPQKMDLALHLLRSQWDFGKMIPQSRKDPSRPAALIRRMGAPCLGPSLWLGQSRWVELERAPHTGS